jgi:hypothetical protein
MWALVGARRLESLSLPVGDSESSSSGLRSRTPFMKDQVAANVSAMAHLQVWA